MTYRALIFLAMVNACVSVDRPHDKELPGSYHYVKAGDTLESICKRYRVSADEIMDINGIDDPKSLRIGQAIFLPDPDPIGSTIKKLAQKTPAMAPKAAAAPTNTATKTLFDFPVPGGTIFRQFSRAKLNPYDGIGIRAAKGTRVIAGKDGKVIFVGDDGTKFGLLVIIEHASPYISVYTHLDKALVSVGQRVSRRDTIGHVGTSGGVDFPRLHFQIRVNQKPTDPKLYLRNLK